MRLEPTAVECFEQARKDYAAKGRAVPHETMMQLLALSQAESLKRMADMMEEDRKPRLELMPEGYIGEQEHRRFMRDSFTRDLAAWETIADAVTYIAGRMPLPASADTHPKGGDVQQAPLVSGAVPNEDSGDAR